MFVGLLGCAPSTTDVVNTTTDALKTTDATTTTDEKKSDSSTSLSSDAMIAGLSSADYEALKSALGSCVEEIKCAHDLKKGDFETALKNMNELYKKGSEQAKAGAQTACTSTAQPLTLLAPSCKKS